MVRAKANASQGIPELIQIATNSEFSENTKQHHAMDAKNGWYRYDVRFALPVYNDMSGKVERYNVYSARIKVKRKSEICHFCCNALSEIAVATMIVRSVSVN